MHPSRWGRRLGGGGGLSGGWVYLSVHWLMVPTCLGEEDHLLGYHVGPTSQHTRRSAFAPLRQGGDLNHHVPACGEGARACWGHEATETGLAYAPVSQAHGHNHIVQCFACCTAA